MTKFSECELCGKGANEVLLLKYPFTTAHQDIETSNENVKENAHICLRCLEKEYAEKN